MQALNKNSLIQISFSKQEENCTRLQLADIPVAAIRTERWHQNTEFL